jgi:protein TonB
MVGAIVLSVVAAHAALTLPHTAQTTGGQAATSTQTATPEKPWPPAGVSRLGEGIKAPRLIRETKPKYTPEAMRNKIEGSVGMEAVIERSGRIGEVRVVRSLDAEFGLDEEAMRAVRRWQFEPGSKDGRAVPVLVEIEMTFTLRK